MAAETGQADGSAPAPQPAGYYEFPVEHHWTIPELAGHVRSTSFLPPPVLAGHAAAFDADLAAELSRYTAGGRLTGTVSFAYELARKPAPACSRRVS